MASSSRVLPVNPPAGHPSGLQGVCSVEHLKYVPVQHRFLTAREPSIVTLDVHWKPVVGASQKERLEHPLAYASAQPRRGGQSKDFSQQPGCKHNKLNSTARQPQRPMDLRNPRCQGCRFAMVSEARRAQHASRATPVTKKPRFIY